MHDTGLNTFRSFDLNGKDMRYHALSKRAAKAEYYAKEKQSYLYKHKLVKKNQRNLKSYTVASILLASAAIAVQVVFNKFRQNPFFPVRNTLKLPSAAVYLLTALASSGFVNALLTYKDNLNIQKSMYKQDKDFEKNLRFDSSVSPKIAVIDEYKNKILKIDWDNEPDMIHGVAVESFIKSSLPNAEITRFDTNLNEKSVKDALELILKSGIKYDALNLSKSSDIKLKDLSLITGFKVTNETLAKDKKIIKERFFASGHKESADIQAIIQNLEKLASDGTKIYISAGNKGKKSLNLYTLAHGVNVVGALNRYGVQKASFTSDNALINRWNKGVFYITKIKDSSGRAGFDINEDSQIDILADETSAKIKKPASKIYGTSFASPSALVNDLRQIIED